MERLLAIAISNALAAGLLALVALSAARLMRRPAVTHALWLLVLLKLLTPPFVVVPIFPARDEQQPLAAPSLALENDVPPENSWPEHDAFVAPAEPLVPLEEPPPLLEPLLDPIDGSQRRLETPEPSALDLPENPMAAHRIPFDAAADTPPTPPTSIRTSRPRFDDRTWMQITCALWAVGSLLWCAVAVVRIARFGRLLRYAKPAPQAIQQTARDTAARMGLRSCPAIEVLPGRLAPLVWFVGRRPRLLLAARLLERLDANQTAGLVAHELAHLRRRDHWVRLAELAATAVYWWNPVLWWVRRELREAEEQCCDAWAVWALRGSARAYAETLLETVDLLSQTPLALPPLASGLAHERILRRRLKMIMHNQTSRRLSWAARCALLALAAALLPLMPGRAQSEAVPQADQTPSEETARSPMDRERRSQSDNERGVQAAESIDTSGTASTDDARTLSAEVLEFLQRLRVSQETAQYMERMYGKGFATKSQLEAARLAVARAQREVQEGARGDYERAKTDYSQARRDVEIAKINIREAKEATFPQEQKQLEARVVAAERTLAVARENLEHVKKLYEKGFSTKENVIAAEFAVTQAELDLVNAKAALQAAREFSQPKALKELEAKLEQAETDLAQARERLEQAQAGEARVSESTDLPVAVTVGGPVAIVRAVNREAKLVYLEPIFALDLRERARLAVFPAGARVGGDEKPKAVLRVDRELQSDPSRVAVRLVEEQPHDPVEVGDIAVLVRALESDDAHTLPRDLSIIVNRLNFQRRFEPELNQLLEGWQRELDGYLRSLATTGSRIAPEMGEDIQQVRRQANERFVRLRDDVQKELQGLFFEVGEELTRIVPELQRRLRDRAASPEEANERKRAELRGQIEQLERQLKELESEQGAGAAAQP